MCMCVQSYVNKCVHHCVCMCVFEQTFWVIIISMKPDSGIMRRWSASYYIIIAIGQSAPKYFIDRCMICWPVKQAERHLHVIISSLKSISSVIVWVIAFKIKLHVTCQYPYWNTVYRYIRENESFEMLKQPYLRNCITHFYRTKTKL